MTRILLTLSEPRAESEMGATCYDEVFLWTATGRSTFASSIDPHLSQLGAVNARNVDLVRIALGVLAADRSVPRRARGSNWNAREFDLTVEVGEPEMWTTNAERLARVVGFLTGDRWTFSFETADLEEEVPLGVEVTQEYCTLLLSGGADSAAGALLRAHSADDGEQLALVSHFSSNGIAPVQRGVVTAIRDLVTGVNLVHHQVRMLRSKKRLDETPFRNEPSTRSRSLLFLALGLAVADRSRSALMIPENGFASLNPAIGPNRRGSLSTRTTHPYFLRELASLVQAVGGHGLIINPFERLTKGEIFSRVADAIGVNAAANFLSATNSCSHTDARFHGASANTSCGVCFGCFVRRAAFKAAGIPDRTTYLTGNRSTRIKRFLEPKSIVEPMRDFADRGVQNRDVMAMTLPSDYAARSALDLCQRGVEEIRKMF